MTRPKVDNPLFFVTKDETPFTFTEVHDPNSFDPIKEIDPRDLAQAKRDKKWNDAFRTGNWEALK